MTFHWTHQPFGLFDPSVPVLREPTEAELELERRFSTMLVELNIRRPQLQGVLDGQLFSTLDDGPRFSGRQPVFPPGWAFLAPPQRRPASNSSEALEPQQPFRMVPKWLLERRFRRQHQQELKEPDAPLTFERHDR